MAHYNGGEQNALDEFNSWLKLSNLVIRHMIVRLDNEPETIEKIGDNLKLEPEKAIKEGSVIDKKEKLNADEETKGVE